MGLGRAERPAADISSLMFATAVISRFESSCLSSLKFPLVLAESTFVRGYYFNRTGRKSQFLYESQ
jgi:hypothetical protein